MKTIIKSIVLAAALLALPISTYASNIKGGSEVTISSPVQGNLYVGAGKVFINARVGGDLMAGCGEITVKDSIGEDAAIGGGNARIEGPIGGDLRIGAGDVTISSNIGGDLVIGSGNVLIKEGVVIFGDLIVGGGSVTMNGTVKGNTIVAAGELKFNGVAEGELEAKGGQLHFNGEVRGRSKLSCEELHLGEQARFGADVAYWNRTGKPDFSGKLSGAAKASFDPSLAMSEHEMDWQHFGVGVAMFWIWRLLSGALLVILLVALFSHFFSNTVDHFYQKYINKFGWGILYLFGLPLAIVVLFVTVIGIPLGLIAGAFYVVSLMLCHALTAVVGAFELQRYMGKTWSKSQLMLVSMGLFAGLKILMLIPFLGAFLSLVLASIALGSVLMNIFKKRQPEVTM
jgi:hypothetical protein